MLWSDQRRDSDPLARRHSPLPTLPGVHPSRRDAALEAVDLQGQPMEVRELPRAAPIHLRKEQARLRGAAAGPQPEETGLGWGMPAAPLPPWIVARSALV